MALGRKSRAVESDTHDVHATHAAPDSGKEGALNYDPESNGDKGRKMSRVGAVGVLGDSDQESEMSVGKQLELESTNSIKYRTCSWQKVI